MQVSDLLLLARDMGLDPEFEGWMSRGLPAHNVSTEANPTVDLQTTSVPAPVPVPVPDVAPTVAASPAAPAKAKATRRVAPLHLPLPLPLRTQVPRPRIAAAKPSRVRVLLTAAVPVAAIAGLLAGHVLLAPAGGHAAVDLRRSAVAARHQVAILTVRLDAARAAAKQQQTAGADAAQHAQQVAGALEECTKNANALVAQLAHVDPHDLASASSSANQVAQSCGQAKLDATPPAPPPAPGG